MVDHPAVIPLRHPYLVAESWKRRGKPLDLMYTAYRRLPELNGAYFLPIDSEDRVDRLKIIRESIGIPIKTDWSVTNSFHGTYNMTWRDVEPDKETVNLAEDMAGFLKEFY